MTDTAPGVDIAVSLGTDASIDTGAAAVEDGQRLRPIGRHRHLVALAPQHVRQRIRERFLVLDHKHSRHAVPFTIVVSWGGFVSRSGARLFAIPHTAWATTATATSFNPCSQPAPDRSPNAATP